MLRYWQCPKEKYIILKNRLNRPHEIARNRTKSHEIARNRIALGTAPVSTHLKADVCPSTRLDARTKNVSQFLHSQNIAKQAV
jgi:hypothetical protein